MKKWQKYFGGLNEKKKKDKEGLSFKTLTHTHL